MLKWSVGLEVDAVAVRIVCFDSAQGRRVSAAGVRPWIPWVAPPRRAACAHRAVPPRLLDAKDFGFRQRAGFVTGLGGIS